MPNRFYDFIDRQGISFAVLNKQGGNGRSMILYSKDLIAGVRAEGNAWRGLFGARKTQPQTALQLPVNDYFGQYSFEILSGIQSQNKNKNFYVWSFFSCCIAWYVCLFCIFMRKNSRKINIWSLVKLLCPQLP